MRNQRIDVLRGIGILAIVIGHSSYELTIASFSFPISRFLYLFHLAIFFFIGGFLIKDKHAAEPWNFVEKKLHDLYCPFFIFCIILLCTRPLYVKLGILTQEYTFIQYIQLFCNVILFQCWGEMTSAMWFLPVYFLSSIFFVFAMYLVQKKQYSTFWSGVISLIGGGFGIYLLLNGCQFSYRLEIAFTVLPIFWVGYVTAKYWFKIDRILDEKYALPIGLMLCWIMYTQPGIIELSFGQIMSPYLFYPVSVLGVVMCLSLAKIILRSTFFTKVFLLLGKYSFEIMALHLAVSKLIDLIYVHINPSDIQQLTAFPRGPQVLFPFYWILNCAIPIIVMQIYDKIFSLRKEQKCFGSS